MRDRALLHGTGHLKSIKSSVTLGYYFVHNKISSSAPIPLLQREVDVSHVQLHADERLVTSVYLQVEESFSSAAVSRSSGIGAWRLFHCLTFILSLFHILPLRALRMRFRGAAYDTLARSTVSTARLLPRDAGVTEHAVHDVVSVALASGDTARC